MSPTPSGIEGVGEIRWNYVRDLCLGHCKGALVDRQIFATAHGANVINNVRSANDPVFYVQANAR
jgi:hypothetical protein